MAEKENKKIYDLEERTLAFARNVRAFIKEIPTNLSNIEDGKQLVRSSGSIGANYIEANESLGKKDFLMRIKIYRKKSKESTYWLKLIDTNKLKNLEKIRLELIKESKELMNIFGAILRNRT
jgi:four helix bundle protein